MHAERRGKDDVGAGPVEEPDERRPRPDDEQERRGESNAGADGQAQDSFDGLVLGLADLLFGELDLAVQEIGRIVDEPPEQLEQGRLRQRSSVRRIGGSVAV